MLFLVPFGDETDARPAAGHRAHDDRADPASGVPAVIDGVFIDTPAGLFEVAEACSGVKFLIAMVALAVLVGWTWVHQLEAPRAGSCAAAALVSVLANGVRAWGTIFVAQWVGAERAGGFDHIVYGWIFFALVIALVLGAAWRFFDRTAGRSRL